MKTAMEELIEHIDNLWGIGLWQQCIKDKAKQLIEKEIKLQVELILFIRLNDNPEKEIVDLMNEFYNKNK